MTEALIENGTAKVPAGKWLMGRLQPVASFGAAAVRSQKGFIVPDRASAMAVETAGESWCADAARPFLTRIAALPDTPLHLVSAKLLVAPAECRTKARSLRLVPMSFRGARAVTEFVRGWVVAATKSRTVQATVAADETLTVRPEALVAWIGRDPTGFCPKLSVWDMILPRAPRTLAYSFHGPCTVWFEGAEAEGRIARHGVRA